MRELVLLLLRHCMVDMRGQYCDVIEPMEAMWAEGSCPGTPPGTCTGTDTPGEIKPATQNENTAVSNVMCVEDGSLPTIHFTT